MQRDEVQRRFASWRRQSALGPQLRFVADPGAGVGIVPGPLRASDAAAAAPSAAAGASREVLIDLHCAEELQAGRSMQWPEALHDVRLTLAPYGAWLRELHAREGTWEFSDRTVRVFLHEPVEQLVAAAVPPRRVPWLKRLLWTALPGLLETRLGRALIASRYRSKDS